MRYCEVEGCKNSSTRDFKMCHFPTSPRRRQKWIDFVSVSRSGWTPRKYSTLCEDHFHRSMWQNEKNCGKKKLRSNAVPSILLTLPVNRTTVSSQTWNRSILKSNCTSSSVNTISLVIKPDTQSRNIPSCSTVDTSHISIDDSEQISGSCVMDVHDFNCHSNEVEEEATPQNSSHDGCKKEIQALKKEVGTLKRSMNIIRTQQKKGKKALLEEVKALRRKTHLMSSGIILQGIWNMKQLLNNIHQYK